MKHFGELSGEHWLSQKKKLQKTSSLPDATSKVVIGRDDSSWLFFGFFIGGAIIITVCFLTLFLKS